MAFVSPHVCTPVNQEVIDYRLKVPTHSNQLPYVQTKWEPCFGYVVFTTTSRDVFFFFFKFLMIIPRIRLFLIKVGLFELSHFFFSPSVGRSCYYTKRRILFPNRFPPSYLYKGCQKLWRALYMHVLGNIHTIS